MADIIIREVLEGAAMTRVEKRAVIASGGKRLDSYESAQLAAELNNVVKWVALDVGVRMSDTEMQYTVVRMTEMLYRNYGGLTIREVRYAFELMLTGDLDEYLPKREGQPDRSAYGAFNMAYVCKVLNAYKAMRRVALKRYRDNMPVEEKRPTPEQEAKAAKEIRARLNDCYRKFLNDEPFSMTIIDERLFYDVLAELGYAVKFDQPIARDINAALTKKGEDAPYARERRKAILKCFIKLKEKRVTRI